MSYLAHSLTAPCFYLDDIYAAAKAADVKHPDSHIEVVREGLSYWEAIGENVGLSEQEIKGIQSMFRLTL